MVIETLFVPSRLTTSFQKRSQWSPNGFTTKLPTRFARYSKVKMQVPSLLTGKLRAFSARGSVPYVLVYPSPVSPTVRLQGLILEYWTFAWILSVILRIRSILESLEYAKDMYAAENGRRRSPCRPNMRMALLTWCRTTK